MSDFILPAGTVVKFGTISTALYTILRQGIPNDSPRQGFLETSSEASGEDAVQTKGIFIGELMAYFAACAAFCNATSQLHAEHQEVLSRFVALLQNEHGEKPSLAEIPELAQIASQAGLPVVLEICLEEDCTISADAAFIDNENAERSWKLWRSAILNRADGIPASWIKKFYFPRLLDYRDAKSGKTLVC